MRLYNMVQLPLLQSIALLYAVSTPCFAFFGDTTKILVDNAQSFLSFVKVHAYCSYTECCTDMHINKDVIDLAKTLDAVLFGQHIAKQIVVDAIGGHLKNIDTSEKPLVMSFHGSPGTGKNYIAEHIARALYKKSANSKFVHKYRGRVDFPLESHVEQYRIKLVTDIQNAISKCPKSLFIFDEVEKMPPGLFDTIVSLLDNHAYTNQIDFRKAIFIFLSNIGGPEIAKMLKQLLDNGSWRINTKLSDFEQTLEIVSYNTAGGLYKSEAIESHVIDHFIPFLPMEVRHVESCIKQEYYKISKRNIDEETLSAITKEAVTIDESGIFSNNGCKRVSKKVESYIYKESRVNREVEL